MELLNEKELIWSSVVANCNMNRQRNLTGVNSYENDLGFDILGFIRDKRNAKSGFDWIDLCCGEANALIQADEILRKEDDYDKIHIEGIDLVDMFTKYVNESNINLKVGALTNWKPEKKYDLITCVHGLHYVGDKLQVLEKIMESLKENGQFIGNIDFENIRNPENKSLKSEIIKYLKEAGLNYNSKMKILICKGNKRLNFFYNYIGADEKAGKNYTGQEVINSIYDKQSDK